MYLPPKVGTGLDPVRNCATIDILDMPAGAKYHLISK
ncbi:uncharacterized protein RAG0_01428 [Rhynchosporium agropyri]|uniref:Uncharacterized protein n=1 Tax=Rhynchosporium agropyri TaxID=914238 RepID=A0A1E1JWW2_9HELO|nr:uncharacterized protein RAG0_01428 [Rhynchosporium agropyri]